MRTQAMPYLLPFPLRDAIATDFTNARRRSWLYQSAGERYVSRKAGKFRAKQ
jgi:hypothetical protein